MSHRIHTSGTGRSRKSQQKHVANVLSRCVNICCKLHVHLQLGENCRCSEAFQTVDLQFVSSCDWDNPMLCVVSSAYLCAILVSLSTCSFTFVSDAWELTCTAKVQSLRTTITLLLNLALASFFCLFVSPLLPHESHSSFPMFCWVLLCFVMRTSWRFRDTLVNGRAEDLMRETLGSSLVIIYNTVNTFLRVDV